jgi:flagellar assembly factor FliW
MKSAQSEGAVTVAVDPGPLVIESRRFGRLEYQPDALVEFPSGLLGFEELRQYARVSPEALQPLAFLVSLEDPEVAFPVLPAAWAPPDYAPALPADALHVVGAAAGDPIELLLIVSVAPDTGTLHANLRGPVLINPATRNGCQIVLHNSSHSLRHILTPG